MDENEIVDDELRSNQPDIKEVDDPKVVTFDDRVEYHHNTIAHYSRAGMRHRKGAPAVEWNDGSKEWFFLGKLHRKDGPAYEGADGTKEWWLNDKLHREDGAAVENADGSKKWFYHGRQINCHSTDEFLHFIKLEKFWSL